MDNAPPASGDVRLLRLRPDGMFSNVNETIEQLRLAEQGGYRFHIDWSRSCYRDPSRPEDPWLRYFAPCFPDVTAGQTGSVTELPILPGGVAVACTRANIITPRLEDGKCNPLLLPQDRLGAHALVVRYIRLAPQIQAGIDAFRQAHFRPRMIGLHIRGPGRTDGGVPELRRRFGLTDGVPLEPFFAQMDHALELLPEAGILACSDSTVVIEGIQERYGDRVVLWPASRSDFGEMHTGERHRQNDGLTFDPHKLGVDVLSEAWLLSETDLFIHGNSNVANFVLCKSPYLIHAYIQA